MQEKQKELQNFQEQLEDSEKFRQILGERTLKKIWIYKDLEELGIQNYHLQRKQRRSSGSCRENFIIIFYFRTDVCVELLFI